ncbi:hypothetical protein [Marinomonas sp. IMCC 4694]|uniref:hypothetical protein n=1 Tax=Marinomonas sp. IMCC 4694 TaxID=2605432 RepID=UPI0011E884E7|nr:hypothetical protein [Marinomonas sp. IMCC 4694]TYL47225.1 hypothetical protein FXV75_04265 [Marinomonas sp. IMCC 4694]
MQQSDIEVYVLSCPTETIIHWLNNRFSVLRKDSHDPQCTKLTVVFEESHIEVTILEKAAGKRFTSIWFDSSKTPWENDIACAKEAFIALKCEVRCNFQGWEEEGAQDPDQWWKINEFEEGPFIWT